jgi:hypothetical protein
MQWDAQREDKNERDKRKLKLIAGAPASGTARTKTSAELAVPEAGAPDLIHIRRQRRR